MAQYIIRAPISQERMMYVPASEAACDLQYPDIDSNLYENDYSQLPAEELCSKHSAFR